MTIYYADMNEQLNRAIDMYGLSEIAKFIRREFPNVVASYVSAWRESGNVPGYAARLIDEMSEGRFSKYDLCPKDHGSDPKHKEII